MGLLLGFIALLLYGVVKYSEFNLNWLAGLLMSAFFYWIGTLIASPAEVLSLNWTIGTVLAGISYCIAGILVLLSVLDIIS